LLTRTTRAIEQINIPSYHFPKNIVVVGRKNNNHSASKNILKKKEFEAQPTILPSNISCEGRCQFEKTKSTRLKSYLEALGNQ